MEFPGMMSSNNSTKEELVSVLKKDNHFYESLHRGKILKILKKQLLPSMK
jgi:hypothetical protein